MSKAWPSPGWLRKIFERFLNCEFRCCSNFRSCGFVAVMIRRKILFAFQRFRHNTVNLLHYTSIPFTSAWHIAKYSNALCFLFLTYNTNKMDICSTIKMVLKSYSYKNGEWKIFCTHKLENWIKSLTIWQVKCSFWIGFWLLVQNCHLVHIFVNFLIAISYKFKGTIYEQGSWIKTSDLLL